MKLLHEIDSYCYKVKNLSNSVNYLIKQCYRIHKKIVNGKALEDWEKELIQEINKALEEYNAGRSESKRLRRRRTALRWRKRRRLSSDIRMTTA